LFYLSCLFVTEHFVGRHCRGRCDIFLLRSYIVSFIFVSFLFVNSWTFFYQGALGNYVLLYKLSHKSSPVPHNIPK
jgi:hypothetical protein